MGIDLTKTPIKAIIRYPNQREILFERTNIKAINDQRNWSDQIDNCKCLYAEIDIEREVIDLIHCGNKIPNIDTLHPANGCIWIIDE